MSEVKEELEAAAVESAALTGDELDVVVGGNAPLTDDPEGETLGEGHRLGQLPSSALRRRKKSEAAKKNKNKRFY